MLLLMLTITSIFVAFEKFKNLLHTAALLWRRVLEAHRHHSIKLLWY